MTITTELSVTTETIGKVVVVRVAGNMVIHNATEFHAHCEKELSQGAKHFIIDLKQCTYMDSAGIGELVHTHKDIRRMDGDDALILNPKIRELLESFILCDLIVPVYDNEEEALRTFDDVVD